MEELNVGSFEHSKQNQIESNYVNLKEYRPPYRFQESRVILHHSVLEEARTDRLCGLQKYLPRHWRKICLEVVLLWQK